MIVHRLLASLSCCSLSFMRLEVVRSGGVNLLLVAAELGVEAPLDVNVLREVALLVCARVAPDVAAVCERSERQSTCAAPHVREQGMSSGVCWYDAV